MAATPLPWIFQGEYEMIILSTAGSGDTPRRWRHWAVTSKSKPGKTVALCFNKGDAERIAQCVNAFDGVDDPAAELDGLHQRLIHTEAELANLKLQVKEWQDDAQDIAWDRDTKS